MLVCRLQVAAEGKEGPEEWRKQPGLSIHLPLLLREHAESAEVRGRGVQVELQAQGHGTEAWERGQAAGREEVLAWVLVVLVSSYP